MLQIKHLTKYFGAEFILDNVSFVLNEGERVALVGPNGSGKTTLLRCIAGMDVPDRGEIIVSPSGAVVGYLPQVINEIGEMTVTEPIASAQADWVQAEQAFQSAADRMAREPDATDALDVFDAALGHFE